jgi:DNA-binding NarL/FixJ family response regulator
MTMDRSTITIAIADLDAELAGRHSPPPVMSGSRNPSARLTEEEVGVIRQRLATGERQAAIAADYRVSRSTIHLIAHGRKWAS